jgi:hypothetical protein
MASASVIASTITNSDMRNPEYADGQRRKSMSKITPCLWLDGTAEEAANFYASLLPDSHVEAVHRAPSDYPSVPRMSEAADSNVP